MTEIETTSKPSNENGNPKVTEKYKCKWNKESIESLLAYLEKHKEEVLKLKSRGSIAKSVKESLWIGASIMLNHQYTARQCATKWKNIQREYKVNFHFFNKKKFDQNDIHFLI